MIGFLRKNHKEALILLILILVAAFFRFYRLPEYMTFLGDEGRDALMVKKILVDRDLPLIGPPTSVGDIYLGPLYYYMMAASMAILWLNPVAAAGMVALIGVLTVILVYYLVREWFSKEAAIVASFLYTVSPVNIIYSRSSWNPNPAPFFTLLAFASFYQAKKKKNFLWLSVTGASLAAAAQMHYLALILLPIFGVLWVYELLVKKRGAEYKYFFPGFLGGMLTFLFLMSPLVIFDFRYNFLNYRGFTALFSDSDSAVKLSLVDNLGRTWGIFFGKLIGRYIGGETIWLTAVLSVLVAVPVLTFIIKCVQKQAFSWPNFALSAWLIGGLAGLSLYRQSIYDHYLGFLNPAPYLLLGSVVGMIRTKRLLIPVLGLFLITAGLNISRNPLQTLPNNQLLRTQQVAHFVIDQAGGRPYNFALIAERNYDAAYQFYLDGFGFKPKVVPLEVTDQLFVVCEDVVCKPVGHQKYEIAAFGWTKIVWGKEISGLKVFKLGHNPEDPNFQSGRETVQ